MKSERHSNEDVKKLKLTKKRGVGIQDQKLIVDLRMPNENINL